MGKRLYLWLAVEPDEYELPLAVADSPKELAILFNTTEPSIRCCEREGYNGKATGRKFVKVLKDE